MYKSLFWYLRVNLGWFTLLYILFCSIAVNLRQLVYRYGMKQANDEQSWDFMFQKYLETPLAQEKEKLLQGLAAANNIPILDKLVLNIYTFFYFLNEICFHVLY